ENKANLAFYSVAELSVLIKNQQITSTELTNIYLDRLKRYGDTLQCVIRITEAIALEQAARADAEIAAGKYRGLLHGIPYGIKDLLAVKGTKTTWGATPYQDQVIDETSTVVKKLEAAGAVMLAKLTLGALAWGDVWYGGVTKNPWNLEQGASGSSAGSAAATVAGLVAFSIGTETLGSIVSPSTRCSASGLRPTYGRVSRTGAMALSWSMDKIGPICRTAEDCAIVFNTIIGTDGQDQSLIDLPFNYSANTPLSDLRIGYLKTLFESDYYNRANDSLALATLRSLGANLQAVELPDDIPMDALRPILSVEAAAAFDELTRSNLDSTLVRQVRYAWPNTFRTARLVPAVEYIQANRLRYMLIQKMQAVMKDFDVIVCSSFGGAQLLITNLTGHPCVVVPNGYQGEDRFPASISFIGNLYDEGKLLTIAKAFQQATDFEEVHPEFFKP
ncbi:MAG: amidase, partial [Bacteroidota bacterium]